MTRGVIGAGHIAVLDLHRERSLLLLHPGGELLVLGGLGPLEAVHRTTKSAGSETRSGLFLGFEGHRITVEPRQPRQSERGKP